LADQCVKNEAEPTETEACRYDRQAQQCAVGNAAAPIEAGILHDIGHDAPPARRSSVRSMIWATASTIVVMKNRINPSSISDDGYSSSTASRNSFAIVAEIDVPGANREGLIRWALPMTKVTAIVSPSARPSASIAPPTTPERAYGNTTRHITSQVV